jgi:hypothetical protein
MTARRTSQRVAEYLITKACRRLPVDVREDRYREWTAELPAIMNDGDVRHWLLRSARALRFAAGTYAGSRRLARGAAAGQPAPAAPAGGGARSRRRELGRPKLPDGTLFAIAAVLAWVTILIAAGRGSTPSGTNGAASTVFAVLAFAPDVLGLIAVIRFVRWLRRRSRRVPPR